MAVLTSMQKFTQTRFMQVALVVLALSFGVWGVQGYLAGGAQNVAIHVNGAEISAQELSQDFARMRQQVENRTGQALSPQQAAQMRLPQQVMRQRIQQVLLADLVDDLAVVAAPEAIKEDIQANVTFLDASGTFSAETYAATVAAYGVTPEQYEKSVGELKALQIMQEALVVKPSDAFAEAQAKRQFAPVDMTLAELSAADMPAPKANSETVLQQFYGARKMVYATPEKRAASFVTLSAEQAIGDMAEQLEDAMAGGQTLVEAANTLGLAVSTETNVALAKKVNAETQAAVQALEVGGTAQIDLDTGETVWVQLTDVTPATPQPFASVRSQVVKDWQSMEQSKALAQVIPKILKAARAKKTVKTALRENGLSRIRPQLMRNQTPSMLPLKNGVYGSQLQNLVAMMKPGQVASFRAQTADGEVMNVLVSLSKRHTYTPTKEEMAQVTDAAEMSNQGVVTNLLIQDLFQQAKIKYKQSVLRRVFGVETDAN